MATDIAVGVPFLVDVDIIEAHGAYAHELYHIHHQRATDPAVGYNIHVGAPRNSKQFWAVHGRAHNAAHRKRGAAKDLQRWGNES